jgi:thioester reductase-like protein
MDSNVLAVSDRLQSQLDPSTESRHEPIAIIGLGLRFPGGASDPGSFWQLLREGRDAISEIPLDRWSPRAFYDPEAGKPGKTNSRWGGFLTGIDQFDPQFFSMSPREAARTDPQQRLLLEVAWEALEDGGQTLENLAGSRTAVFVGISSWDYAGLQTSFRDLTDIDVYTNIGGALSIVANRISYCFNLQGPSAAIDTACSSALVAVHFACQSIWEGGCRLALAGGVNVLLSMGPYIGFSRLAMLSADGRCRAFDARANGFVRSEGAGVVVLKPLAQALADGDRVYALIRGTAVNQDGRTSGITVPSQAAQAALVREACRNAGVSPADIQFVEAHGTGTLVGDPIEARALGEVLSVGRADGRSCLLGSVKTNIGHLEAGAGIAGLIKAALALAHREVPANLHFEQPNPEIPFEALKLRIPRTREPWPACNGPALAGVNSFGFGGTNAHVVLEGVAPWKAGEPESGAEGDNGRTGCAVCSALPLAGSPACLLPLSARSPEALQALARSWKDFLWAGGAILPLRDLCCSAGLRRTHHDHRLAFVAHTKEELGEQLQAFATGQAQAGTSSGRVVAGQLPRLAFVFSGQGPQWWAMGRQLLAAEPVFRDVIHRCDALGRRLGNWSLLEELSADEAHSRLEVTAIAQPAIFALQAALATLWRSWGVRPEAVVGHSVGEVAAAHWAGVLSLEDAMRIIFHRGRCMELAPARGRMLAVGLPLAEAEEVVARYGGRIALSAVNSPTAITLSGEAEALEEVARSLQERQLFVRFLQVNYAFHSAQMDSVQGELLESLRGIRPQLAELPLFSTVTGQRLLGSELGPAYWWDNVRRTVRFADGVERLLELGCDAILELSPHPVLLSAVAECFGAHRKKVAVMASLRRKEDERATLLRTLGQLYTLGYSFDGHAVWPDPGRFVGLPLYPWQRERFWHESGESAALRLGPTPHPLLGTALQTAEPSWENRIDLRLLPYLADHLVQKRPLLPATGYLEMAFAAAKEVFGPSTYVLEDVKLARACILSDAQATVVQTAFSRADGTFQIHSETRDGDQPWTSHVCGVLRSRPAQVSRGRLALDDLRARCPQEVPDEQCYAAFSRMGLEYGPAFRGLQRMWRGKGEALGQVRVPEGLANRFDDYLFHPAVLDACFHALGGILDTDADGAAGQTLVLPVEIERVWLSGRPSRQLWSHARLAEKVHQGFLAHIDVYDETGTPIVEVRGLRCQAVSRTGRSEETLEELLYEYEWRPQPRPGQQQTRRSFEGCASLAPVVTQTLAAAAQLRREVESLERYGPVLDVLDKVCAGFIWQAFLQLGGDLPPGRRFHGDALAGRLGVAVQHRRLLDRYLSILAEDGVLARCGDEWEVRQAPACTEPERTWKTLLQETPSVHAEMTLIGRCGRNLAGVLRGEINPLSLIFPDGSLSTIEHLYQDSPTMYCLNMVGREALCKILEQVPSDRTVRILEIGAGTGGLTSFVLPWLRAGRTEYVFTDLSTHFFPSAQEKFRHYPCLQYQKLDIAQDPAAQGFPDHSFDIVLASEVLHATSDLRQTVGNIRQVLASEGVLLFLEPVQPLRWFDLVFGLTEGWWKYTDTDLRPSYPLLSVEGWKGLLEQLGFTETADVSVTHGQDRGAAAVILSRGPKLEPQLAPAVPTGLGAEAAASWLLFADRGGTAKKLAGWLWEYGESCTLVYSGSTLAYRADGSWEIDPANPEHLQQVLAKVLAPDRLACRGVVHLWNLDAPAAEGLATVALEEFQKAGVLSVLHLVQAWSAVAGDRTAALWLVTRGAHSVGADPEPAAIAQTPLSGMGRVIVNEFPQLHCKMVDLDPAGSIEGGARWLFEEFWVQDEEDEIALRGGARYVHRYRHSADAGQGRRQGSGKAAFRLMASRRATLDGLTLRTFRRQPPGPGAVEIQVCAAALNFSDVLKALDLHPGLPDGPVALGAECSGRITAVGEGVEGLRVGDPVVAIAHFAFSSHVTTAALFTAPLPPHLTFEEAATLPVAFLTAAYALEHLGHLSAGEKVLIHSATGGVGLAALQLARRAGAEVFATAGTPEKRELLRALDVECVMDSRSLDFADEVLERTGGRGVDVVLNSLAGEALARGLATLADYGRFLEIGKRDIYQNSRLGLKPFRKNLSFMAIDLDPVMYDRPLLMSSLFQKLMQDVRAGAITPLPHRVFSICHVVSAFRCMQQAKHIGKVVVSVQGQPVSVLPSSDEPLTFRPDATYLLAGGLGGFGLAVARWMVERGARHLVLMGRRGIFSEEARQAVAELQKDGTQVVVFQGDVSQGADVAAALAHIDSNLPPLRGVLHAAMVLEDCLLLKLDWEQLRRVMAPKMNGAWNLHTQTLGRPLDHFILFSSLSSVLGVAGQANYAAANTFLDALTYYRRAHGLPSLTVNWGYLGGVGYIARHGKLGQRLEGQGIKSFSARQALTLMERLLQRQALQVSVIGMDWLRWRGAGILGKVSPRFADLYEEAQGDTDAGQRAGRLTRQAILSAPPEERKEMVQTLLREKVARALGSSASRVDMEKPLLDLGIDSLMAVELRNWMEGELQVMVPITELMRSPSLGRLSELLLAQLSPAAVPAGTPGPDGLCDPGASNAAGPYAQGIEMLKQAGADAWTSLDLKAEVVLDEAIRREGPAPATTEPSANIFLTGATGFLGAFLLDELLRQTRAVIHCLILAPSAAEGLERLRANLETYGLWQESIRARVMAVVGDLTQPLLGLSEKSFQQLADQVDAIYHSGAAVDFVSPYQALKPVNVRGTHEILRLASRGKWKPVHYVSTLSVFSLRDHVTLTVVREEDEPRHCEALYLGYPQSKWVAEQLALLGGLRGLPVCVYRPGAITGHSQTGAWHLSDFIFRAIRGCLRIGAAPEVDVTLDMTPVDFVSGAIVRLSQRPASPGQVFHLVNAQPLAWNDVVAWLRARGYSLRLVSYNAWREELLQHSEFTSHNPLFGLSPFIGELGQEERLRVPALRFEARNTLAGLAGSGLTCAPADGRLLETYFDFGTRIGLLPSPPGNDRHERAQIENAVLEGRSP